MRVLNLIEKLSKILMLFSQKYTLYTKEMKCLEKIIVKRSNNVILRLTCHSKAIVYNCIL